MLCDLIVTWTSVALLEIGLGLVSLLDLTDSEAFYQDSVNTVMARK